MIINKKRKHHSAFIITNLAKIGFFGGTLNHLNILERNERIKKIKLHMQKFKDLTTIFKKLNQNTGQNEEMTRNFLLIKDEIKGLEENLNIIAEKTLNILVSKNIIHFPNQNSGKTNQNNFYNAISNKNIKN